MDEEDPNSLHKFIKGIYMIHNFTPANAKDYENEEVELFRDLHAKFIMKGFDRMPRGMTGLDSGQPWFIYWLT